MARPAKPTDHLVAFQALFGTMPDQDIAEQAGSTVSAVGRYRRSLGIAAYDGNKFGGTAVVAPASAPKLEEPVKRRRGRPKKVAPPARTSAAAPVPAAGAAGAAEAPVLAAGASVAAPVEKRKPGLPRKVVDGPTPAPVEKRKPGRPRKVVAGAAPAQAEKRRPGRPRKVVAGAAPAQVVPALKAAPAAPTPTSAGRGSRVYTSKLDAHRDVVGKLTDREVAALAGVSRDGVRDYRKRHNIPSAHAAQVAATVDVATAAPTDTAPSTTATTGADAAQRTRPAKATAKQRRPRTSKLDPFVHLIGKLSDRDVAAMAGVTYENVRAYRARRGIARRWAPAGGARKARGAAVPSAGNEPTPTPLAAPAAVEVRAAQVIEVVEVEAEVEGEVVEAAQVPMSDVTPVARRAASSQGYKVETRDEAGVVVNFIVVAANVAEAAAVAQDAVGTARPGAQITAIRHLGQGLA